MSKKTEKEVCNATVKNAAATIDIDLHELHEGAKDLMVRLKEEVKLLEGTLGLSEDYYGVELRAHGIKDKADRLVRIAAKMDALRSVKYTIGQIAYKTKYVVHGELPVDHTKDEEDKEASKAYQRAQARVARELAKSSQKPKARQKKELDPLDGLGHLEREDIFFRGLKARK